MTTTSMEEPSLTTAVLDREHQNRVQSRLCALPEEVIVEIMYQMREADLYFIRHVSHLFFGLFRGKRFWRFGGDWIPSRFIFSRHEGCTCQMEVQVKLLRSSLCQPCQQRIPDRTELDLNLARFEEKLRCSGCGEEHQRLWFSREQLFKLHRRKYRRCILWEGRVRLCSHVSFTWGHVRHWVESRHRYPKPDGFAFLECKQCFDGVHGARPPKVEFLEEKSTNGKLKREIEMSWTVPLSAVDGEFPGQHRYEQLLCPHVTWKEVRTQARKERYKDFTCRSCRFEYSFSTEEGEKGTFVQGRRLLWSSAEDENEDYDSRIYKVRLMDPESYEIDTSLSKNVLWCDSKGCFNAKTNPSFHFDSILSEHFRVERQSPHYHQSIDPGYLCRGLSTTHYTCSSDIFQEFKLCSCKGAKYVVDDIDERQRWIQEQRDEYPWLFPGYVAP
ncbi:hypothetical protein CKAH01_16533 [Colletotrichum kahawae]|uniref:F-box domain-containing protein n=1 Tax=Colletotrichum kahawae TaxID=34407 RepID=A0AAE0D8G1_COLKA|nr:hypothetical protein CKAH01_16533 [Colletotrichum kahawae]